jgi:hypothetical protein
VLCEAHERGCHGQPPTMSRSSVIGEHFCQTSESAAGFAKCCDPGECLVQPFGCSEEQMVAPAQVRPFVSKHGEKFLR